MSNKNEIKELKKEYNRISKSYLYLVVLYLMAVATVFLFTKLNIPLIWKLIITIVYSLMLLTLLIIRSFKIIRRNTKFKKEIRKKVINNILRLEKIPWRYTNDKLLTKENLSPKSYLTDIKELSVSENYAGMYKGEGFLLSDLILSQEGKVKKTRGIWLTIPVRSLNYGDLIISSTELMINSEKIRSIVNMESKFNNRFRSYGFDEKKYHETFDENIYEQLLDIEKISKGKFTIFVESGELSIFIKTKTLNILFNRDNSPERLLSKRFKKKVIKATETCTKLIELLRKFRIDID